MNTNFNYEMKNNYSLGFKASSMTKKTMNKIKVALSNLGSDEFKFFNEAGYYLTGLFRRKELLKLGYTPEAISKMSDLEKLSTLVRHGKARFEELNIVI